MKYERLRLKELIYSRYPDELADLIRDRYEHIVLPQHRIRCAQLGMRIEFFEIKETIPSWKGGWSPYEFLHRVFIDSIWREADRHPGRFPSLVSSLAVYEGLTEYEEYDGDY